jgi:hypothetical protein
MAMNGAAFCIPFLSFLHVLSAMFRGHILNYRLDGGVSGMDLISGSIIMITQGNPWSTVFFFVCVCVRVCRLGSSLIGGETSAWLGMIRKS